MNPMHGKHFLRKCKANKCLEILKPKFSRWDKTINEEQSC